MMASEAGTETVWQVALEQSKYWKSINPKACEPREGMFTTYLTIFRLLPCVQTWTKLPFRYRRSLKDTGSTFYIRSIQCCRFH